MEIIYLLTGLIVGALLGIGATIYFKQKKQITDISTFEKDLTDLKDEIRGYKDKVVEDKGRTDQLALDMRASVVDVNRIAENLKTTLVSGGSQNQGAWGELLLQNILDSIGFREGEEYELQKVFKDDDDKDQKPDVIVHYPGKRDITYDELIEDTDYRVNRQLGIITLLGNNTSEYIAAHYTIVNSTINNPDDPEAACAHVDDNLDVYVDTEHYYYGYFILY